MANGATVGGYFQIDVNVLRDGNNNPISLNNIALYRDEQSTFPEFFTGETIYEGYSYTSLYQELTVGQSYTLGFGNMVAKHMRANVNLAGIMTMMSSSANCTTACSAKGFACDNYAQQQLATNIATSEYARVWGVTPGRYDQGTGAPLLVGGGNYYLNACRDYLQRAIVPPSDVSTITCTSGGYPAYGSECNFAYHGRLCACGGWRIIVTI